jgi:hypothetical protein
LTSPQALVVLHRISSGLSERSRTSQEEKSSSYRLDDITTSTFLSPNSMTAELIAILYSHDEKLEAPETGPNECLLSEDYLAARPQRPVDCGNSEDSGP